MELLIILAVFVVIGVGALKWLSGNDGGSDHYRGGGNRDVGGHNNDTSHYSNGGVGGNFGGGDGEF